MAAKNTTLPNASPAARAVRVRDSCRSAASLTNWFGTISDSLVHLLVCPFVNVTPVMRSVYEESERASSVPSTLSTDAPILGPSAARPLSFNVSTIVLP